MSYTKFSIKKEFPMFRAKIEPKKMSTPRNILSVVAHCTTEPMISQYSSILPQNLGLQTLSMVVEADAFCDLSHGVVENLISTGSMRKKKINLIALRFIDRYELGPPK